MGGIHSSSRRNSRVPGVKLVRHSNSAPGSARLPRRESSITSRSQEVRPDPSKSASLRYRRYSAFPDPSQYSPILPSPRSPRLLPRTPQPTPRLTDTPFPRGHHLVRRDTFGQPPGLVTVVGPQRNCDY